MDDISGPTRDRAFLARFVQNARAFSAKNFQHHFRKSFQQCFDSRGSADHTIHMLQHGIFCMMPQAYGKKLRDYVQRAENEKYATRTKATSQPQVVNRAALDFQDLKVETNLGPQNGPAVESQTLRSDGTKAKFGSPRVKSPRPFHETGPSEYDEILTTKSEDDERHGYLQSFNPNGVKAEDHDSEHSFNSSEQIEEEYPDYELDVHGSSPPGGQQADDNRPHSTGNGRVFKHNGVSTRSADSYPETTSGRLSIVDADDFGGVPEKYPKLEAHDDGQRTYCVRYAVNPGSRLAPLIPPPGNEIRGAFFNMPSRLNSPPVSGAPTARHNLESNMGHNFSYSRPPALNIVTNRIVPNQYGASKVGTVNAEHCASPKLRNAENHSRHHDDTIELFQSLHPHPGAVSHQQDTFEIKPALGTMFPQQDRRKTRFSPQKLKQDHEPSKSPNPVGTTPTLEQANTTNPNNIEVTRTDEEPDDQIPPIPSEPDLDYAPPELYQMDYEVLKLQSFDTDPKVPDSGLSEEYQNQSLAQKLRHVADLPSSEQHTFFSSLSLDEWEEAGDWYLDRFGEISKKIREARRAKRDAAKQFESEIQKRHEAISKKRKEVEDSLKEMKESGGKVLHATPKKIKM